MPALELCVGDPAAFFERHWAVAPLLHQTGADAFRDLASLGDLDAMVASLGLDSSHLRMVRDGKTLPPSDYTLSPGGRRRSTEPLVHAPLVYRRYQEGATIVLEALHRYWRPLTDFCRELELSLGHRLQVNAYITPPGSRGFDVHRDDHDVFVLQVSGSKHWIVHDKDTDFGGVHDKDTGRVLIDEEISAGAALYIPAGFPHAASTGATSSAHLTVGILTHDSIDVVREVVKLAEEQPAFTERLDLRAVADRGSLRGLVERELEQLRAWLDKVDLEDLTERVARRVLVTSQPIARGLLSQLEVLDGIHGATPVRRRRGATCVLFPRDTSLKVLLADRELEMPAVAHEAMEQISRSHVFTPSDIGSLDLDSALVLVRRLIREGLLEVAIDD